MAYTQFTTEKLFINEDVNILLNRMYSYLVEKYTLTIVNQNVALTGAVARMLQGSPQELVQVIPIITSDVKVLNFIKNTVAQNLGVKQSVNYRNRITMSFTNVNIEFWLSSSSLNTVTSNNLIVQEINTIPSYIL